MSATDIGRHAEDAAAAYLGRHGYEVAGRNYRRPQCEIDIVARKGKCVYFVEVKYRHSASSGSGLEYVTPKKQRQMERAARIWLAEYKWTGESVLSAIEVSGRDFEVGEFIESIV